MITIAARLVAESAGLPPMWRWRDKQGERWGHGDGPLVSHSRIVLDLAENLGTPLVDLSDPQTAFGVALQLDEWEGHSEWSMGVAFKRGDALALHIQHMAARLTHIGQDHAIRRALGWTVEAGTLATLEREADGLWVFRTALRSTAFDAIGLGGRTCPALAGITDPDEARNAIYEAVSPEGKYMPTTSAASM